MDATQLRFGAIVTTTGTSLTPAIPSGLKSGAAVYAAATVAHSSTDPTCTASAGWTLVSGPNGLNPGCRIWLFRKDSFGDGDAGPTLTLGNIGGTNDVSRSVCFGVDDVGHPPQTGAVQSGSGTSQTVTIPTVNHAGGADSVVVAVVSVQDDRSGVNSAPAGGLGAAYATGVSGTTTSGSDNGFGVYYALPSAAGAVSGHTQGIGAPNIGWAAIALEIRAKDAFEAAKKTDQVVLGPRPNRVHAAKAADAVVLGPRTDRAHAAKFAEYVVLRTARAGKAAGGFFE